MDLFISEQVKVVVPGVFLVILGVQGVFLPIKMSWFVSSLVVT